MVFLSRRNLIAGLFALSLSSCESYRYYISNNISSKTVGDMEKLFEEIQGNTDIKAVHSDVIQAYAYVMAVSIVGSEIDNKSSPQIDGIALDSFDLVADIVRSEGFLIVESGSYAEVDNVTLFLGGEAWQELKDTAYKVDGFKNHKGKKRLFDLMLGSAITR